MSYIYVYMCHLYIYKLQRQYREFLHAFHPDFPTVSILHYHHTFVKIKCLGTLLLTNLRAYFKPLIYVFVAFCTS